MPHELILLPIGALALLTFLVLGLVPVRRFRAAFAGQVGAGDFRYGESPRVPGEVSIPNRNYMNLLVRRSRMEGFVVFDYFPRTDEAMSELVPMVMNGTLRHREDIRDGLEKAPQALVDLYTGANKGKLLVKIA